MQSRARRRARRRKREDRRGTPRGSRRAVHQGAMPNSPPADSAPRGFRRQGRAFSRTACHQGVGSSSSGPHRRRPGRRGNGPRRWIREARAFATARPTTGRTPGYAQGPTPAPRRAGAQAAPSTTPGRRRKVRPIAIKGTPARRRACARGASGHRMSPAGRGPFGWKRTTDRAGPPVFQIADFVFGVFFFFLELYFRGTAQRHLGAGLRRRHPRKNAGSGHSRTGPTAHQQWRGGAERRSPGGKNTNGIRGRRATQTTAREQHRPQSPVAVWDKGATKPPARARLSRGERRSRGPPTEDQLFGAGATANSMAVAEGGGSAGPAQVRGEPGTRLGPAIRFVRVKDRAHGRHRLGAHPAQKSHCPEHWGSMNPNCPLSCAKNLTIETLILKDVRGGMAGR